MKGLLEKHFQTIAIVAIILLLNVLGNIFHFSVDLTEDKRFTVAQSTKDIVVQPDDNIYIKVLLDGDFPAGFKRLRSATLDLLVQLKDNNPNIVYEFEDPTSGTKREVMQRQEEFQKDNLVPVMLSFSDGNQVVQKPIFPFAIIHYKNKKYFINLLEEQLPGDDENEVLNKSMALLEYKFAEAFQRMLAKRPKRILMTEGNGEWEDAQLFRLEGEIRKNHMVGRIDLDSIMKIDTTIDLLIVPGPRQLVELKNLFKIDQYIMMGGRVIWLIDKMEISLDSINKYRMYIPSDIDTGIDNILFKYGARIMPDLIMDLECSSIPQVVGMQGDKPQTRLFPWFYHPAIASQSAHPMVKNIDRVNMSFPSSVDTVQTPVPVRKTILLTSSPYSRVQLSPVRLSFEILKTSPDPSKFNNGNKAVAVLLEGKFESAFKNRLTPEFEETLKKINLPFLETGKKEARQLVVSDSDFTKNLVNFQTGETEQIGFNKWERKYYKGNRDFIVNAVEYMLDEYNIMESRSKEIKLRMLDTVKTREEGNFWKVFNLLLPVVFVGLFGFLYMYWRKRKYASR